MLTTIAAGLALVLGCVIGFMLGRGRQPVAAQEITADGGEGQTTAGTDEPLADDPEDLGESDQPSAAEVLQQRIDELQASGTELHGHIEELEAEMRRLRRRAGEQLQRFSDELENRWNADGLGRQVHALNDEVDAEQLAELERLAAPMRGWMSDFGLGSGEMYYQIGLLDTLAKRPADALRCFEKAAFDGMVPEGWLAVADCQWNLDRPKAAARSYQRCLEHKRMPVHAFQRVAEVAVHDRRYEEALQILGPVMSRKRVPEEVFVLAALASRESGDAERAIELCEKGLNRFEDSPLLLANMIIPLSRIGEADRAESCARRAQEVDPEHEEVLYALGVMRMDNGDEDAAVDLFEQALVLREEYPEALCCLGVICNRRGQYQEALRYLQPAVQARPDYAQAYFNMKESYEGLRDFDNAIAMLNRAVQLNPDYS